MILLLAESLPQIRYPLNDSNTSNILRNKTKAFLFLFYFHASQTRTTRKTTEHTQDSKLSAVQLTGKIIRERGIFALYNGISASLLRQLTYSTTRFGLYEIGKNDFGSSFVGKVLLAGVSGAAGGKLFV